MNTSKRLNLSNWHVLIIDDDRGNLDMLTDVLKFYKTKLYIAASGEEAIAKLAEMPVTPRFILTDISMPGMDGFALLQEFRRNPALNKVAIIALTANAMRGDEERILEAGFNGYISKPLPPPPILLQRIMEAITKMEQIKPQEPATNIQANSSSQPVQSAPDNSTSIPVIPNKKPNLLGWNLMIIDDDPTSLAMLTDMMRFYRANLYAAASGQEALNQIGTMPQTLACILTDISMPGMDGFALLRELRKLPQLNNVTIIALTANALREDEERVLAAGFDGYITKPLPEPPLLIQRILDINNRMERNRSEATGESHDQHNKANGTSAEPIGTATSSYSSDGRTGSEHNDDTQP